MTYARTGRTYQISLLAGQSLVIKELSGTTTVTGSGAPREDASSSIGAGFVVYGPQSADVSVSLTTTGECDYSMVNGDPTPGPFLPVTPHGLVWPDGEVVPIGEGGLLTGLCGDSLLALSIVETSQSAIAKRPLIVPLLNAMLGQPFELVANMSKSGARMDELLDNYDNVTPGGGFGNGANPGFGAVSFLDYIVDCSGTNDIAAGATLQTLIDRKAGLYSRHRTKARHTIACTVPPAGDFTADSEAKNLVAIDFNKWIRNVCATTPGMILWDVAEAMRDPSGSDLVGNSLWYQEAARLHWNNVGAERCAAWGVRTFGARIPRRDILPTSSKMSYGYNAGIGQLIDDPLFLGSTAAATGTGVSGTLLSGWTVSAPNSGAAGNTVVASVVDAPANPDGTPGVGKAIKLVVTAAAAGVCQLTGINYASRAQYSTRYRAAGRIVVTGPSGAALTAAQNLAGVQPRVQTNFGSNLFNDDLNYQGSLDKPYAGSLDLVYRTLPWVTPASGSKTNFLTFVVLTFQGAGTVEFYLNRPCFELVS